MPRSVVVTIYTDGTTNVDAPDDVHVTIRYALAPDDGYCRCGDPIHRNESGEWEHLTDEERDSGHVARL